MNVLKCIAVDDEPLALKLVEKFIDQTPFLSLTAACSNAMEAMKVLRENLVDILFLDINMPGLSGMELARLLKQQSSPLPKIIFTTAYNHYAIEGYKVDAVDYLLKPFNYEEFLIAATKALNLSEPAPISSSLAEDSIFVKVEHQWVKISYNDILFIESLKDYVKLHLKAPAKDVLTLTSLKALEERLPHTKFLRTHRSYIISLDKITSINKTSVKINDTELPVGEQYRDAFKTISEKWQL